MSQFSTLKKQAKKQKNLTHTQGKKAVNRNYLRDWGRGTQMLDLSEKKDFKGSNYKCVQRTQGNHILK